MYINTFSLQVHFSALSICAHCVWGPYINVRMEAQRATSIKQTRLRWSSRSSDQPLDGPLSISHLNRVTCVYSTNSSPNSTRPQVKIYICGALADVSFPFCLCPKERKPVNAYAHARETGYVYIYSWLTGLHEDIYPTCWWRYCCFDTALTDFQTAYVFFLSSNRHTSLSLSHCVHMLSRGTAFVSVWVRERTRVYTLRISSLYQGTLNLQFGPSIRLITTMRGEWRRGGFFSRTALAERRENALFAYSTCGIRKQQ